MPSHDAAIPEIVALASQTDGCVRRRDLVARDIDPKHIARLADRQFLRRVFPGVYLVGAQWLTRRSLLGAGLLWTGPGSLVVGVTGLELRCLHRGDSLEAHVASPRQPVPRKPAAVPFSDGRFPVLRVHRLDRPDTPREFVADLPTTLVPRTFIDAVEELDEVALKQAWREATFRCVLDETAVAAEFALGQRRPGTETIRQLLAEKRPVTRPGMDVRSREGELRFLELVAELGLPEPEVNVPMRVAGQPYVADFFYRQIGLIVETDGGQHDSAADKVRDLEFRGEGLDVARIDNERMKTHWDWCKTTLAAAYRQQELRSQAVARDAARERRAA